MNGDQDQLNRKRKSSNSNNNNQDFQIAARVQENDEGENDLQLTLSLISFRPSRPRRGLLVDEPLEVRLPRSPPPALSPPGQSMSVQALLNQIPPQLPIPLISPSLPFYLPTYVPNSSPQTSMEYRQEGGPSRPLRSRRLRTPVLGEGKSDTVPPPYPWATKYRATVHSLKYMESNQISTITGQVQCKRCEQKYELEYPLVDKFNEVGKFIQDNIATMHDRAPSIWMNPVLPTCELCGQETKPIMAEKKRAINWLFLFLGQMLGCCNIEQLKYFCKHTKNHRTAAKDRILYLTYLGLCKQLEPAGL